MRPSPAVFVLSQKDFKLCSENKSLFVSRMESSVYWNKLLIKYNIDTPNVLMWISSNSLLQPVVVKVSWTHYTDQEQPGFHKQGFVISTLARNLVKKMLPQFFWDEILETPGNKSCFWREFQIWSEIYLILVYCLRLTWQCNDKVNKCQGLNALLTVSK